MNRQTNRQTDRERKPEGQKRDAASSDLRSSSNREPRYIQSSEREVKTISLNRHYMNDLYERSSI